MVAFNSSLVVPEGNSTSRGRSTAITGEASPDLSIICVNWNSLDYLLECIASIYEHTRGISYEVIVVDNASPEGRIEILEQQFPQVKIVRSDKNIGFAGANNLGFRQSSGQHVLLLNPDTKLIGPAITIMLEQIDSLPDAGIVGCKLLNTDLSTSTSSIQKFPTILNQLLNVEYLRLAFPSFPLWDISPLFSETSHPIKVEVIPGACMMLKRDTFERVGLLTEDYFMYAEDIDLNYKLRKLGLSSYYVGAAQIVHHGGGSSSRQKVSQWSTVMTYKAMLRFYRTSRGRMYAAAYRAAMGLAAAARLALLAIMFPFGDRDGIRCAAAKWSTVLKWALGVERLGVG
jgi:N-acetylglucosaminyl-diphospho-decaprenol L-rhamnosyltransferase